MAAKGMYVESRGGCFSDWSACYASGKPVLAQDTGIRDLYPTSEGRPAPYPDYIASSKAELMVAKGMYVDTRSGWFSDRSPCYLACGKPALARDTGSRNLYPMGEGLRLLDA